MVLLVVWVKRLQMQIQRYGNNDNIASHIIGWLSEWVSVCVCMCFWIMQTLSERTENRSSEREKKRREVAERTMSHWQPSFLISCNVCQWYHIQWAKANKIIHIGISFSPLTFHHLTGKLLLLSLHTNWLHISFIIKFIFASLDNRRLNNQMNQNRQEERMCWRRCC